MRDAKLIAIVGFFIVIAATSLILQIAGRMGFLD